MKHNLTYIVENDKAVIQFYLEPMPHPDDFKNNNKEYALLRYNSSLKNWQSSVKTATIREEDKEDLANWISKMWFEQRHEKKRNGLDYSGMSLYDLEQAKKQGINIDSLEDRIFFSKIDTMAWGGGISYSYTASLLEETKEESQDDMCNWLLNLLMRSYSKNQGQDFEIIKKHFILTRKTN